MEPESHSAALNPGQTLSHYRIEAKLGEGGMGVVYKARDTRLDRFVAIKTLCTDAAGNAERKRRFLQEAKAASALNHPNILHVYDVDVGEGVDFIAMEYVEGKTLQEMIGRRGLPVSEALKHAVQIADGLATAHFAGIVHRDIKPGNIMVNEKGLVKILDFGLAKLTDPVERRDSEVTQTMSPQTEEGTIVGTVAYMSPEQAEGKSLDARSDIFSFGSVVYEMISGRQAFQGDSKLAVMSAVLRQEPKPLEELTRDVPYDLLRLVTQCLRKDPGRRFQHMEDVKTLLEQLLEESGSGPARTRTLPAPMSIPAFAKWTAAGLVPLAMLAWYLVSQLKHEAPVRATFTQLTSQPGEELYPSLSPDGKSFAYQSRVSGNWDIYLQRVGGKNPINLTKDSPADDTQPAFSPDGEQIAFRSERDGGGIFVMGATGESAKRVTDFGYNPAWSPDGRYLVCSTAGFARPEVRLGTQESQLYIVPAGGSSGSSDRRLVTAGIKDAVQPQWSPGGRRIAFWSIRGGNRDVWTVPADGGTPVQVTREPAIDWHPVWSPDGQYLYFLSDRQGSMNLWRVPIDENSGRVLRPAEQLTTPSAYTFQFSLSHDGHLAYVNRVETGNIYEVDFDPVRETVAGPPIPVTRGSWRAANPDISPDGQWVAFKTYGRHEDLFVSRVDGSNQRQLTDDEWNDRVPRWSPDGKRLAFYSNRSGPYQIWTIAPDGSGLQQLTRLPELGSGGAANPVWSPDGRRLVFGIPDRPRIMDIGKPWDERSLEALPALESANEWFVASSWSPDGHRLAGWRTSDAGNGGISIYAFDSGQYQHFNSTAAYPRWLSDSRRLIFSTTGGPAISVLDSRSGKVHQILSVAPSGVYGVAPSPDDRRIYFGLNTVESDVWLMSRERQ
jgi:Tol biopolymer transport system component/tRNA A-37 threonylcarbamoyl transferase component Bud32